MISTKEKIKLEESYDLGCVFVILDYILFIYFWNIVNIIFY